jgi:hypothetical protein
MILARCIYNDDDDDGMMIVWMEFVKSSFSLARYAGEHGWLIGGRPFTLSLRGRK